jgi:conjugal transfer/entry exclusion protein
MNAERIAARIEELRNTAKQHEAVLMQISGAVQELINILAELSKEQNAPHSIDDPQGT